MHVAVRSGYFIGQSTTNEKLFECRTRFDANGVDSVHLKHLYIALIFVIGELALGIRFLNSLHFADLFYV